MTTKTRRPPKEKNGTTEAIDMAAARQAILEEQERRRQAFGQELNTLLQKHGCELVPVVTIVGSEISTRIQIRLING